jgi:hypothetical protein
VRWHRLSDEAAAKIIKLLALDNSSGLPEGAQLVSPTNMPRKGVVRGGDLDVLEPKCGVPVRFILMPKADPTGRQAERSIPTEAGKILGAIESALGIFLCGQPHIDNTPRPIHYVIAFKPVARDAEKLWRTLTTWSDHYRNQITVRDGDLGQIETSLLTLVNISNSVMEFFKSSSSMGRRKENALYGTIRRLRKIFLANYKGPTTGRRKKGAFQYPSERESREVTFVETALLDAGIRRDRKKLAKDFRDPRCAISCERAKVIERIGDKVDRGRR